MPEESPVEVVRLHPGELPRIGDLLERSGLAADGLDASHVMLFGVIGGDRLTGCAAVEVFGPVGLLRSVAVVPEGRGRGLGGALVRAVEKEMRRIGVTKLYLLTETAEHFFAARGYRAVERSGLPEAIVQSGQFVSMCPASAVLMTRNLPPPD